MDQSDTPPPSKHRPDPSDTTPLSPVNNRRHRGSTAATDTTNRTHPGVGEMPLFPLNVVLFPAMPLPLHIFEERYREMINHCVRESLPFGIVLVTGVDDVTGGVETSDVGCTARVAHVERLPDGRMNIEVVGESRFRILDTHEQLPYRVGMTELVEDAPGDTDLLDSLTDEVQRLLREYLTRSLKKAGKTVPEFDLPEEPEPLSYLAASLLPVENDEKQLLLSEEETAERLTAAREHLRREVTRLRRADESRQVLWRPVTLEQFAAYRCNN